MHSIEGLEVPEFSYISPVGDCRSVFIGWIKWQVFGWERKKVGQPSKDASVNWRGAASQLKDAGDVCFEEWPLIPSAERGFHIGVNGRRTHGPKKVGGSPFESIDHKRREHPATACLHRRLITSA